MRAFILAGLSVLAACAPDVVDRVPDVPDVPDVPEVDRCEPYAAQLEGIASTLDAQRAQMGIGAAALAVVVEDCVFTRGFGVERADGAGDVSVTEHTRFQLASMTKTFTAVAALSLEEDGALDRSAPISELVATTSTATLDEMLAHTAGYPTDLPDASSLDITTYFERNANVPMWAPPGEVWLYSNPGYGIAGLALANAAGTDFESVVEERVFAQAGMADAVMGARLTSDDDDAPGFAHGMSGAGPASFESIAPTDAYLTSTYYGPMGGAWASAADLGQFMKTFVDGGGSMLSSASLDDMSTARAEAYGASVGYGQGLFTVYDGTVFHSGSVAGFLSEMDMHRETRFGVAVLSAADWNFPYDAIYEAFDAFGPPLKAPPDDDAPAVSEIVGAYVDGDGLGTVTVREEANGALIANISSLGEGAAGDVELENIAPGVYLFFYEPWAFEIDVTFTRGAQSSAMYFVTLAGIAAKG